MRNLKSQAGVGLMEVMVAALILAVAVLGFIALQYRSLDAANEAYYRTQAMSVARDLAERIRANQFAQQTYLDEFAYSAPSSLETPKEDTGTLTPSTCNTPCTQEAFAIADAYEIKTKAQQVGMQIAMQKCSGVERNCIYIAWDETLPKDGNTTDKNCTSEGTYIDGSRCIVMEAYQ